MPSKTISANRFPPLRQARTCYGHLAGRLGVAVTRSLVDHELIRLQGRDFEVTPQGQHWFTEFGLDLAALYKQRRRFARCCIDGTERVPHLAGALGDAFTTRLFELGWIRRPDDTRAVQATRHGRTELARKLGLKV